MDKDLNRYFSTEDPQMAYRVHEKVFNITNNQGHEDHNDISPHTC